MGLRGMVGPAVAGVGALGLHVLGQGEDHRAGPARSRDMKRAAYHLGNARRVVDLGDPFGHLTEEAAEIDLLEGLALGHVARDLADEQDQRGRILMRGMDADRRVGRARPAGDERDAGFAGHLAVGLGHVCHAAFLAADDEVDRVHRVVERVQGCEVALARHAIDGIDAVQLQAVDEDLAAGAEIGGGAVGHGAFPWAFAFMAWLAWRKENRVGGRYCRPGIAFASSIAAPKGWIPAQGRDDSGNAAGTCGRGSAGNFICTCHPGLVRELYT